MFSSLFWLVTAVFHALEPEESLSLSGYENATSIETLVAKLQAELVPPPIAFPMKSFHAPPHAGKNTPLHHGKNVSLNPAAVLGPRQTCTTDNYCFANNPGSYCPNCGICCTQASGGWCCAQTGTFCCNGENGGKGGCCNNGAICTTSGCILPTVTITSTFTSWATVYDYVTQYRQYIQTLYQTVTVSSSTTVVVPATGGAKIVKRTAAIDEETRDCRPTATYRATPHHQPTQVEEEPEILTATVLSSPNYDLVELKLQQMGLLVKRVATITSTVTVTASATTTLISSIFVTTTSVTTGLTTVTALVTFTSTSSGAKTSQTGNPVPVSSPGSTTTQNSASGLSTGAKAGIGVASAAGSAIICILFIFWWRHRSKKDEGSGSDVAAAGAASSTPGTIYEPKFQTSPQSQSPSYSQYTQMYPQQNQGGGGGYRQYPQDYQQHPYPQQGQGYNQQGGWGHAPLSPTSGPDPSAMPFEVGGEPMFPHEMPDPVVHEMSQSSPIMRVASPVRKPVGGGLGRIGSL